jgi:hypothetical protein
MTIRFSRLRTFLLTFAFGLLTISIYTKMKGYFPEIPVNVPQVESEVPIIIRLCPEWRSGQGYVENGNLYFSKEKAVNCTPGGGGG